MKNCITKLTIAFSTAFALSALGGPFLDSYWPLNDGDQKTFVYGSGSQMTMAVSGDSVDGFDISESYTGGSADLAVTESGNDCYLTGVPAGWINISFDPPVLLLDDNILENGGTVRTSTTVHQTGVKGYSATFTIRVAKVATVKVPGGTFTDCRSITASEVAHVPGRGTVSATALTAYLAPGVGVIKTRLSSHGWASLLTGTVGGIPVGEANLAPITVQVNGDGAVTPNYNGQSLQVGQAYTMTAKARNGEVFAGWTDDQGNSVGTSPKLAFTMQNGLVLQATFIPNPFAGAAGIYTGLFSPDADATVTNSGLVRIVVSRAGAFSGYFQMGLARHPISSRFDGNGDFAGNVQIHGKTAWPVTLNLNLSGGNSLSGTVSDGSWTANINANRSAFNPSKSPAPQAGAYTLTIAGTPGSAAIPAGNGFASAKVSKAGGVTLAGSLADGTRFSQSAFISQNGEWPLYVPLYRGAGCVFGWISLDASGSLSGEVNWVKPSTLGGYYPDGFSILTSVSGSPYVRTNTLQGFNFTQAIFSGGALAASFTNGISITANKVKNLSSNRMAISFNPSTGILTGTVVDPSAPRSKPLPFGGVVLQGEGAALGYVLEGNQSGTFSLETQ